ARERLDLRLDAVAPREVVVRARLVELGSQGGEALAVLAPSALVERRARVAEVGAHREAAVRRDARRGSRLDPRLRLAARELGRLEFRPGSVEQSDELTRPAAVAQ